MPQHILDPGKIPTDPARCPRIPAALPPKIRSLGHLPAVEALLPGDLILISPLVPTKAQKMIQAAQAKGGYGPDDAHWTHAAVYLGTDFAICEATVLQGVHHASLLDSLATHRVRVRRDLSLDADTRWRIALAAALQIGTRYGWVSALKISLRAQAGLHTPRKTKTQSPSALICSELYADAFLAATGRTLQWRHPGREVSPALLSFVDELDDVEIKWQRI